MKALPYVVVLCVVVLVGFTSFLHRRDIKLVTFQQGGHSEEYSDCFVRQNRDDFYFYLAAFREDRSYVWVGSWNSLTLSLKAAELLNCHVVVDPSRDTPKPVVPRERQQ